MNVKDLFQGQHLIGLILGVILYELYWRKAKLGGTQ